jgi:hypothetical protein
MTKSGVLRPTTDTGLSGSSAERAVASANGMFLANSAWIRSSSSGKMNSLMQFSGSHSSSGSDADTVSQVVISGVKPSVPYLMVMYESVSPLVV